MPTDHSEILELFQHDWNSDRDNRDDALDDLKFIAGDQWEDEARSSRQAEGRPVITVNRMGSFVRSVSGDLRQSAPAIEPIPVEDQDEELTDIYAGIIRQIEYQSNAGAAYAHGAEGGISCGIGHWRVLTDFTEDTVFDQEIKIKRIVDHLSVIWDGDAVELDRKDAKHCFVTEIISKDAFRRKYPKATATDFPNALSDSSSNLYWDLDDTVRIAEHWWMEPVKKTLGMTSEGKTLDLTNIDDDIIEMMGIQRVRKVDTFKVMQQLLSGADFLTEPKDWAGIHIPIIPMIGNEIPINGQVVRHGLVRWAKDSQRLYNYWRSSAAEVIAASPKAPWTGTVEMFEGLEEYWNVANQTTLPYLPYNRDPESPGNRPTREQPPTAPTAMWTEASVAVDDMKATTGIHDASLGARGNETSGRAIIARQREGDIGSFIYFDNFNTAIRRTGEILIDLIPKIYDADRTIRIIGFDDAESFVAINREVLGVDGMPEVINDLSAARFDVRIKTGPSYMTAKIEAREQLTEIIQSNPALMQVIGDLVFESMDFPGSDKVAERMKKAMDPAIVGEEDDEPQQPDPVSEALQRIQMAGAELDLAQKEADVEKTVAETEKLEVEAEVKAGEAFFIAASPGSFAGAGT